MVPIEIYRKDDLRMKKFRIFTAPMIVLAFLVGILLPVEASSNVLINYTKNISGSDFEQFNSIAHTSDGGYITAGYSSSVDGDYSGLNKGSIDATVFKFDSNGKKQWAKNIGGSCDDMFNSIIQTSDGGYIAAGLSYSFDEDFKDLNKFRDDAVVVKLDNSGNKQWIKNFGGKDYDEFRSIIQTSDGGYIAAGSSSSNDGDFAGMNKGNTDAVIVRFDRSGNKQWVKTVGGTNYEDFTSIAKTSDGGYIAAGCSSSNDGDFAGMKKGSSYAIVVKFDGNGNKKWLKNIGGTGYSDNTVFDSVIPTSDGGYIAAGGSSSKDSDFKGLNKGDDDAVIVKFDKSGNKQWVRNVGGSGRDVFLDIVKASDGGYIAAGSSDSNNGDFAGMTKGFEDAVVVKFDSSGNKQWVKTVGGSDHDDFCSVTQTSDGRYVAAGFSYSEDGDFTVSHHNDGDAVVVKLSAASIVSAPAAPTNVKVTAGNGQATVSFTAPANNGGSSISKYTVTAAPSNGGKAITVIKAQSPITVTGLQNGVSYKFTVYASSSQKNGASSSAVSATPMKSSVLPSASASSNTSASSSSSDSVLSNSSDSSSLSSESSSSSMSSSSSSFISSSQETNNKTGRTIIIAVACFVILCLILSAVFFLGKGLNKKKSTKL